jgi:hypothetical protein
MIITCLVTGLLSLVLLLLKHALRFQVADCSAWRITRDITTAARFCVINPEVHHLPLQETRRFTRKFHVHATSKVENESVFAAGDFLENKRVCNHVAAWGVVWVHIQEIAVMFVLMKLGISLCTFRRSWRSWIDEDWKIFICKCMCKRNWASLYADVFFTTLYLRINANCHILSACVRSTGPAVCC